MTDEWEDKAIAGLITFLFVVLGSMLLGIWVSGLLAAPLFVGSITLAGVGAFMILYPKIRRVL